MADGGSKELGKSDDELDSLLDSKFLAFIHVAVSRYNLCI